MNWKRLFRKKPKRTTVFTGPLSQVSDKFVIDIESEQHRRESKAFDRKVLDGDITVPKDTESKDILQIQDEWGQNPHYRSGRTPLGWTEFKERNPELFKKYKMRQTGSPYTMARLILKDNLLGQKVTLTGSVLDGILFHEENDAVIHYTLEGNIPPNGDYIVTGTLNGKTLNVTSFKLVEII